MRTLCSVLIVVGMISLGGCAGAPPIKNLVEEVCDQYGPASRECKEYRRSYQY